MKKLIQFQAHKADQYSMKTKVIRALIFAAACASLSACAPAREIPSGSYDIESYAEVPTAAQCSQYLKESTLQGSTNGIEDVTYFYLSQNETPYRMTQDCQTYIQENK